MNIQFDVLHAILAVLCVILLIVALRKKTPVAAPIVQATPAPVAETAKPEVKPQLITTGPDSALQLLALLQQDARFIDFIQEDLTGFSDEDIGAVARVLHEGSAKVLKNYFQLERVRSEAEETRITLAAGFDASEVRLTGNVVGSAPFTGTLVHRGWKVTEVKLPKLAEGHNIRVLAPAEVEL